MRWLKRDVRKIGIALAGILPLLFVMTWLPVSAAGAYKGALGLATQETVTVQDTPIEDATVTALNKELLTQQVAQQQHTWDNWLWGNAATILSSFLSTLVIVIGALFGLWRWRTDRQDMQDKELKDRQNERDRRTEERFQAAVTGLGDEKEGARIGAAIVLRTFLHPGYEQFYTQTFDLAVANLRLRHLDPDTPEPLTSLSQALIIVFKESFPLARKNVKPSPQFLDASCIQLDNAHLADADLQQAWLPEASLRNAALRRANFSEASLYKVNLSQADLKKAILTKANLYKANLVSTDCRQAHLSLADLRGTNLSGAKLSEAKLSEADLTGADLKGADLAGVNLTGANLKSVNLTGADLKGANLTGATLWDANLTRANLKSARLTEVDLRGANLTGATLWYTDLAGAILQDVDLTDVALWGTNLAEADLSNADLSKVKSWEKADVRRVKGLTSEQLARCEKDGAINVEYPATRVLLQSLFVTPSPERSPDTQASSTPDTQESTPPPHPSGNGTVPSQQEPES